MLAKQILNVAIIISFVCYSELQVLNSHVINTSDSESITSRNTLQGLQLPVRLDHFDPQNPTTWNMHYDVVADHFIDGGPIIIYNNDWYPSPANILFGVINELGIELNGYLVAPHPRFYGNSRPTDDLSVQNLQFLSIDQTIADFVQLIEHIKQTVAGAKYSPVIFCGVQYGGTLGVWLASRHPHLINGVWAINTPLEARPDFRQKYEAIGKTYRDIGRSNCYDRIQKGFQETLELLETNYTELSEMFNTCDPINPNNRNDRYGFFHRVALVFETIIEIGGQIDGNRVCNEIINPSLSAVEAIAHVTMLYSGELDCLDANLETLIDYFSQITWMNNPQVFGERSNLYLQCSELGWYRTTTSLFQPFGHEITYEMFIYICARVFNGRFTSQLLEKNAAELNNKYGGMNINVKNAYFTTDVRNTYRRISLTDDLNKLAPTDIVEVDTYMDLLFPDNIRHSDEVRRARNRAREFIREWVTSAQERRQ